MSDHDTLAAALAAFQADLPVIDKGETATVETKGGGSYSYTYADLADISHQVMPLLAEHGLSFTATPTHDEGGRFVLAYSLLHTSGESRDGAFPLPNATPQQVGSAITYARRYCLCAVTGVAPADEDDDGRAAQQASPPRSKPTTAMQIRAAAKEHSLIDGVRAYLSAEHDTDRVDDLDADQQDCLLGLLNDEAGREYLGKVAADG